MRYLIISITASVVVSVLLKFLRKKEVSMSQVVWVNYLSALLLSVWFLKPNYAVFFSLQGYGILLSLGLMLPIGFIVMSKAVEQAGIVKADVAQRLSLVLTLCVSFLLWKEPFSAQKIIGILIAFLALACLLTKTNALSQTSGMVYLFLVWLCYGICDLLLKLLSKTSGENTATLLSLGFLLAFVLMGIYVLGTSKLKIQKKSFLWGLFLGLLNFINIFSYIEAHKAMKSSPSLVFTTMNIGVMALGTLVGAVVFKEKLSFVNVLGIITAIIAVMVIYA